MSPSFGSRPHRWVVLAVCLVVAVAVAAWTLVEEDPTPVQQAQALHEIEPMDLAGLRLDTWNVNGPMVHATYVSDEVHEAHSGFFTLTVWDSKESARRWFEDVREALSDADEVQQINTFADVEYCASVAGGTRCVGWDGNRTFEGYTRGTGDVGNEFDALGLIRTARKHWYRVYS